MPLGSHWHAVHIDQYNLYDTCNHTGGFRRHALRRQLEQRRQHLTEDKDDADSYSRGKSLSWLSRCLGAMSLCHGEILRVSICMALSKHTILCQPGLSGGLPEQLVNAGWTGREPGDGHPLPLRNLAYPCGGEQAMDMYEHRKPDTIVKPNDALLLRLRRISFTCWTDTFRYRR